MVITLLVLFIAVIAFGVGVAIATALEKPADYTPDELDRKAYLMAWAQQVKEEVKTK